LFKDRLEQGIQRAKKDNKGLALFFLDLDHFKSINDSLGHNVGDEVLKSVTHRLTKILKKEDTLARLGGDEFTIIMGNINDTQEATQLAEKIIGALSDPITVNLNRLYVSFSIGISLYPEDGDNTQNLLKYADAAMYKAKDGGRNDFQFYSSEMTDLAHKRVVMEANLQDGLKNEDFLVYYQPQFNAKSNKLIGLEALVRWKHPIMGLVKPSEFIALAEATGLVVGLDKFVMKTAMKQIYKWHSAGLNPGVVSLNISIRQLQKKDFISFLKSMMAETKCKKEWLELEITEGHIMSNPKETIEILNQISDMGIRLSIDDFGTGYSSLSHLKKLPISKLKIDRSFVEDLPHNQDSAVIAKSIIALAHSLNLTVIAEGVETIEQKEFLLKNGCENIQGYLYSKPIPEHELEIFLKEGFNIDNSEFKFKFW
jgi:diguanylate cyclase (GGDEF)-like protein